METLIASGKTKRVFRINDTDYGEIENQDVITWDDEFSVVVPDKGDDRRGRAHLELQRRSRARYDPLHRRRAVAANVGRGADRPERSGQGVKYRGQPEILRKILRTAQTEI